MPEGRTVYIVIIADRHLDIKAHPFISPLAAIEEAKRIAHSLCTDEDDYEEHDYGRDPPGAEQKRSHLRWLILK